jgi:hypothetical protein
VRDHSAILAAYETLQKGRPQAVRDGDSRVGSKHNRRNRGFVRVDYAGREIHFYPTKFWPSVVGVSVVTLRNWLNRSIIVAYQMHNMDVMCKAELHALKGVVARWYSSRDMHNAIEPAFQDDLKKALAEVRLALDTLKRKLPMSAAQTDLLAPSLKD